jgi:anaerobic selenocysteine-containing dehydrogenase
MTENKVTFCRICEASCGLIAKVDGQRVLSLVPDPDHVVTRGYACVKGTKYTEVHHSPDRIKHPLKRVGERFEPISWDQAFLEIGEKARAIRKQHGRDGLGLYMGNPSAFSAPHPIFGAGFMSALGSKHLYTAGSQDCNNKFAAAWEMFGSPLIQPVPDFDNVRCFIIIGSNPAISQMSFIHAPRSLERLKAIEKQNGKVYFVNPRRTETAQQVGEQVFIRPDTDVFFLLSFVHELFKRNGLDAEIARYLDHVEALRAAVKDWPAERTQPVTGISATQLRKMVADFADSGAGALYGSTGLNQGRHGTLAVWLLNAANAVSGNLDRRGGLLFPRGAVNMGLLGTILGTGHERTRSRIGDLPAMVGALPAAILPDEILTPGKGQLRGMFISAGNPVLSCPNGERLQEAFAKLDLLVAIDMFRNESARHAHYILPVPSFLERSDIPLGAQGYQPKPYLQLAEPVVAVDGEQKEEWWIFTRIADAMGIHMFNSRVLHRYVAESAKGTLPSWLGRAAFDSEKMFAIFARLTRQTSLGALKQHAHGLMLRETRPRSTLGKRTRILRRGGRVDVAPKSFVAALPEIERTYETEKQNARALKLITKRERASHNSWMHNVDAFVKPPKHTNYLFVHPEDADERSLRDGDLAEIKSASGTVVAPVKRSDDLMPGVVALPHGWGHAQADGLSVARRTTGVNANVLAADGPGAVEALSGMAHLTGIVVNVRKVHAERAPEPDTERLAGE